VSYFVKSVGFPRLNGEYVLRAKDQYYQTTVDDPCTLVRSRDGVWRFSYSGDYVAVSNQPVQFPDQVVFWINHSKTSPSPFPLPVEINGNTADGKHPVMYGGTHIDLLLHLFGWPASSD
jgi:hypothetical protein